MFSIGIPTLNRADLLIPTLEKYKKDFHNNIHVIDNGNQPELVGDNIIKSPYNLGVAASWNKLCDIIFKDKEWALLVNDDVYLGYDSNTVNQAILRSKVGIVQSIKNWSVILISKELYNKVGRFDEQFYPAYYEDSDYMYRIRQLGMLHEIDFSLNPLVFKENGSYEKDPELINNAMRINRLRYITKWGGLPLLEYNTPEFWR